MELLKQIQNIIEGSAKNDPQTLAVLSKDASLYKVRPQVGVFPKNTKDIQALVKFASEQKKAGNPVSLTVRSGGTDMSGGALGESIVLSMTKSFNRTKEVGADFAVVEPGVYYRDFDIETLKKGLILPSFPASREICTVGGMVANNAGGELNLLYGKTERYVQELKMVCADGKEYTFKPLTLKELKKKIAQKDFEGDLYKKLFNLIDSNFDLILNARPQVSKNSAGYYLWNVYDKDTETFDVTKLIVGSQGTLGIITEIKFGLVKPKEHERLLVVFLNDFNQIPAVVNQLLPFQPQSIESYDDKTFKMAIKLLPDIVTKLRGGMFKLAFGFLPELWMLLTGGVPKMVLLVELVGNSDGDVEQLGLMAQKSLVNLDLKSRFIKNPEEARKYWVIRHEAFSLFRNHLQGRRTAPFIDDFVVKPQFLAEFLPRLYKILGRYNLLYTIQGHVGDGNFHIIPLMKLGDKTAPQTIKDCGQEVYDLVFEYGGSMSGEHNDGLVRSHYLEQMYGPEVYKLFEQTKDIFDPLNIFNPGKKVYTSFEYTQKHLDF